jgi:hypothetical protein
MKNNYHHQQSSSFGLGRLFTALGYLSALILIIGLLDKAGVRISLPGQEGKSNQASFYSGSLIEAAGQDQGEDIIVVASEPSRSDEGSQSWAPVSGGGSVRTPAATSSRASVSVENWVERFASTAVQQAIQKGVPAGIALAVGIAKLQSGHSIDSWETFMEQVVLPLTRIKNSAPEDDRRAYFKYSANSERWAEGLNRTANFSASVLKNHIQRYGLHEYDREAAERLASGEVVDLEMERKARAVANQVSSARRTEAAAAPKSERAVRPANPEVEAWNDFYEESVGYEVAREVARKKLKSGQYISEEDLARLAEETNAETSKTMGNKLSFLGRKINPDHPDAKKMQDITDPRNAQAREELYQRKLQERKHRD